MIALFAIKCFYQEMAQIEAFSVFTNLWMDLCLKLYYLYVYFVRDIRGDDGGDPGEEEGKGEERLPPPDVHQEDDGQVAGQLHRGQDYVVHEEVSFHLG